MGGAGRIIAKVLTENNSGKGDAIERAQFKAQVIEQRMVKAALKSRNLGLLDQDLTVRQIVLGNTKSKAVTAVESELSLRLHENGLELAKDSPLRWRPGLAVLRAKGVAMQDPTRRALSPAPVRQSGKYAGQRMPG